MPELTTWGLHKSVRDLIRMLPREQQLDMWDALTDYAFDDKPLELNGDTAHDMIIVSTIPLVRQHRGAPVGNQNAKGHGAPKGNQNAKKTKTNKSNNSLDKDKDKDKDKEGIYPLSISSYEDRQEDIEEVTNDDWFESLGGEDV